jgi:hypothetical protein
MPLPPDVKRRLDHHAALAREEFVANWKNWSVNDVADWWMRWCQFGKTNHDRLGHILTDVTGAYYRAVGGVTRDEDE